MKGKFIFGQVSLFLGKTLFLGKANGITRQKKQRYRCKECGKQFLFALSYCYRAWVPLLRQLIVPMTLNGSGIRDTGRVLGIIAGRELNNTHDASHFSSEPEA